MISFVSFYSTEKLLKAVKIKIKKTIILFNQQKNQQQINNKNQQKKFQQKKKQNVNNKIKI